MAEVLSCVCGLLLCLALLSPTILGQEPPILPVDSEHGNDTACLSAQELLKPNTTLPDPVVPCRTINKVLGYIECSNKCGNDTERIENVTIQLEDGVHRLEGCIGLVHSRRVRFVAANRGKATITCESFPNATMDNFDNLAVCRSSEIQFDGIRFEKCGPVSPNVFLSYTADVSFHNCVF